MGSTTLEPHVRRSSPDLTPGTLVGDYRIDHTIGVGGMGAVYQATQPVIGKRVAIKLLHRSKSQTALSRFVKEARAVNLIGHPNIVDVFGFGMTDDGRAYLVMELLVGETLAVRGKRGAMSLAELAEVLIEVTHALEAAHEAGVIHRDLKPENIFLAKRKGALNVKLLDFGIAKLIGDGEPGNDDTRPGVLIGTPRYISPEQVRGKVLDGGADIYALGVVAFELVAGRPPFTATDSFELFEKHAKLKPPKPSAFNAELPEAVDALIGGMLAKEPGERPSLAAIRDALTALQATPAAAVAGARTAATMEPTDVHAVVPAVTTTVSDRRRPAASGLRRLILPAALIGAASGGISIALALSGGSVSSERVAPRPTATVAPAAGPGPGEPTLDVSERRPPTQADDTRIGGAVDHPLTADDRAHAVEPEIELEPVAAGGSAHAGPRHASATHAKHDHTHASPPEAAPAARPSDKTGSAVRGNDGDDAVRSPFEHAP